MTWQFDDDVAEIFPQHARQHIPNYDQVLNLSLDVCNDYSKTSKILDVGCATGETLKLLEQNNFTNIYGVDNSKSMIKHYTGSGKILLSENFPVDTGTFDVILMNWTLHFIKDKTKYLTDVFNGLNNDGVFVLTDKTSLDPYSIKFYHQYKRSKGVSEQAIRQKELDIKDIMYIDSVEWYLENLKKIGFTQVNVANASWCFTSFVCQK